MSVSSVGSTACVGLGGEVVNLEQALDETCRGIINEMNHIQLQLRLLAAAPEQDVEYSTELEMCGKMDDHLRQLSWLFDDLRHMQCDLVSVPSTPEEKNLLKAWKLNRKELEKRLQAEHADQIREERAAAKAALKLEKMNLGESKMEE